MKHTKMLMGLLMVILLAAGIFTGCTSSSSDGGGCGDTGTVTGVVTDPNNQPIQDAQCSISASCGKGTYSDTSDEQGVYEILGVPAGTWTLSISATGYVTETQSVTVNSGSTTQVPETSLAYAGQGTVIGRVTSSQGPVLTGAYVTVEGSVTTSDSNGDYVLNNVPAGTWQIKAALTGYQNYSSYLTVYADMEVTHNIVMEPAATPTPSPGLGSIGGKVVDSQGLPLYDVQVSAASGNDVVTSATGVNGEYLLSNLMPGSTSISYSKSGYVTQTITVTVLANAISTAPTVTLVTQ